MSKEAIIQKIISDAEIRANSFIEEQKDKADDIIAQAAEQCKTYYYGFKNETEKAAADIAARAKTVAELDAKKLRLAAKQRILDGVFSSALEKLLAHDRTELKKLLLGMLAEAEDGDVVTLGKRQKGLLTAADINAVAKKMSITLSLSDQSGEFDGMMLSGGGVDKNFTFESEIALLRDSVETQIAKELFA